MSRILSAKKFCNLLLLAVLFLSTLIAIAVLRVLVLSDYPVLEPCLSTDRDYIADTRGLSKRLSNAVKFQTINYGFHDYNRDELRKLIAYISKSFPLVHSSPSVSYEVVNNLSLLYYIKGSDAELKPYLLTGHMDVVPVEESYWEEEPFSGTIKDGYIWGRGTIDSKHIVMGTLEALEFLLEKGYKPKRSFYLAYGHDEESGGLDGAQYISQLLKSRNVELEYLLDEGSFVMDDFVPGITSPVALISVSEKGSLNLELKVRSIPGHSSFPSRETAIVILSKALSKLGGDIFPSMFGKGPEESLFEELAHCAPFPFKVVFKNLWLFKYPVIMYMSDPVMSAVHRTTVAVTIVTGGNKINVLPSTATANLNLRVHPAQTNNEINVLPSTATANLNLRVHPAQTNNEALQFVKNTVRDERVEINVISQDPPHPFSPTDSLGYYLIRKTIRQIYNNSCVAPMTLIANTDSRWYLNLTRNVYRFSLIRMKPSELDRFHGHNERISVENYEKVVNFFLHLIKNSDDKPSSGKHSHNEL